MAGLFTSRSYGLGPRWRISRADERPDHPRDLERAPGQRLRPTCRGSAESPGQPMRGPLVCRHAEGMNLIADSPLAAHQPPNAQPRPARLWVAAIAIASFGTEMAVSARYGYHRDELYFLAAGHHLAFGYVDQPPLTPLLTRITDILGVSPTAIRIIPALAGGAIVIMAARLAALFGAGRLGR